MSTILPTTPLSALTGPQAAASVSANSRLWGEDGFTFSDFIDIINPLQHIPLVDEAYRAITGDEISTGAKIAGDTLLAGTAGLMASLVDSTVKGQTGASIGEHLIALLTGGGSTSDAERVTALTDTAPSPEQTHTLDRLQQASDVAHIPALPLPLIQRHEEQDESPVGPLSAFHDDYRRAMMLSVESQLRQDVIA